jgi:hypothetical protein
MMLVKSRLPNVTVEWLTRFIRIREEQSLNLDLETAYPY